MKPLFTSIFALAVFWINPSFSLGLGNETLHSSLGQKLLIEMPISGISQLDQDQLRFSVANVDVYELMNVEFRSEHQKLRLSIIPTGNGKLSLIITSHESIKEPFLDFVVSVNSPIGQLFKEVSVLLDTPL